MMPLQADLPETMGIPVPLRGIIWHGPALVLSRACRLADPRRGAARIVVDGTLPHAAARR